MYCTTSTAVPYYGYQYWYTVYSCTYLYRRGCSVAPAPAPFIRELLEKGWACASAFLWGECSECRRAICSQFSQTFEEAVEMSMRRSRARRGGLVASYGGGPDGNQVFRNLMRDLTYPDVPTRPINLGALALALARALSLRSSLSMLIFDVCVCVCVAVCAADGLLSSPPADVTAAALTQEQHEATVLGSSRKVRAKKKRKRKKAKIVVEEEEDEAMVIEEPTFPQVGLPL